MGGIDKGSGTVAWVTEGSRVGAVPEEGAVGASEDTSLGARAWDGGGRFSWQGGGGVDGWGPTSTRRCGGGGGGAGAWTVLGDECGTVGISSMDGLAGV